MVSELCFQGELVSWATSLPCRACKAHAPAHVMQPPGGSRAALPMPRVSHPLRCSLPPARCRTRPAHRLARCVCALGAQHGCTTQRLLQQSQLKHHFLPPVGWSWGWGRGRRAARGVWPAPSLLVGAALRTLIPGSMYAWEELSAAPRLVVLVRARSPHCQPTHECVLACATPVCVC